MEYFNNYDLLVESVRSGLIEGETLIEAIDNFNNSCDENELAAIEILNSNNKTMNDLENDVKAWLDI